MSLYELKLQGGMMGGGGMMGMGGMKAGVPEDLQGCHTILVDDYVIDGHVPVEVIRKLLSERPPIAGITLPGMPEGSPGMSGTKHGPFTIYAVTKDGAAPKVYATL